MIINDYAFTLTFLYFIFCWKTPILVSILRDAWNIFAEKKFL